jgi:hypothetical protein
MAAHAARIHAPARAGGTLRALVAFGSARQAEATLRLVEALGADHPLDLAVISVARFQPVLCAWAPASGMTTCASLRDDATVGADALAREVLAALPGDVRACHSVVLGWSSPLLVQPLRAGVYDALVLGCRVGLRRRALAQAAACSASRIVTPRG